MSPEPRDSGSDPECDDSSRRADGWTYQTLEEMFDARMAYRTREFARSDRPITYWANYERCAVCGVGAGLPCHTKRRPGEVRDEAHFYRERVA